MHSNAVIYREDYPFGQLPVLEVTEGDKTVVLAQSNSIMRYIGRLGQHGIYPADPLAACQCDEVSNYTLSCNLLHNHCPQMLVVRDSASVL
jgi:glutathione S-transferase